MKLNLLILFIVLLFGLCRSVEVFWCWTKPDEEAASKKWDLAKMGGPNWGFCADPSSAANEKVDFQIYTQIVNVDGAGGKGSLFI